MRSRNEVMTPHALNLNDEGPSNAAHWYKVATEATAELAALRKEAESFQMAYRMKCDEETKALEVQLAALRKDAAELRELLKTAGQWITSALSTLDTIEPECSTEAELLTALIRSGEMLALSTRHRATTGPIGAPIAPEHADTLNALSEAAVEKWREMMRDAARLAWLAEHTAATGLERWVHPHQFLRAAIDAAMQAQPR